MMNRRHSVMPPKIPAASRIGHGKCIAATASAPANSAVVETRHHQLRTGCSRINGRVARISARPSSMANPLLSGDGDATVAAKIRERINVALLDPLLLEK